MEELVEVIAKSLVSKPDKVSVSTQEDEHTITVHLKTDPVDTGKVIGKAGRIVKAIRAVVTAASSDSAKKVRVSIDG